MSESRYRKIGDIIGADAALYLEGSPVVVSAAVLLDDMQIGKVLAQVKFRSIISKTIIAVIVDFYCYDINNVQLEGLLGFQYLDLSANRGTYFGEKIPVYLPDSRTRKVTIVVREVLFADNAKYALAQPVLWETLPSQHSLIEALGNQGLVEQYIRETNPQAKLEPLHHQDLWMCCCGEINHQAEEKCVHCSLPEKRVFATLDQDKLKAGLSSYKALVLKKQQQQAREASQRKKKVVLIIVLGLLLIVAYAGFLIALRLWT
jgi:hypothetical protein